MWALHYEEMEAIEANEKGEVPKNFAIYNPASTKKVNCHGVQNKSALTSIFALIFSSSVST